MTRPIQIERVKTVFLVVLFLMTILLLYFSWKDSFFGSIKIPVDFLTPEKTVSLPNFEELIKPSEIVVNFGSDTHTVVNTKGYAYWDAMLLELNGFMKMKNLKVTEITKNQFDEAMNFRSMRIKFDFNLPFKDTLAQYGIQQDSKNIQIDMLTAIGYSTAIPDSLIIYDGKNQKYFRFVSEYDLKALASIIDKIEKNPFDPYFPMSVFLGIDSKILMPISVKTQMTEIGYGKEFNYYETEKIVAFAQAFFGEGFDFVRKITENNGTTIYMYGYGQKILILNKDGAIEYKEEIGDAPNVPLSYYDSLNYAVNFIGAHGSWESLNGTKLTPFLKDSKPISVANKNGYRFTFGMFINDHPLYLNANKEVLSIDIIGNRILNYKRQMFDISQNTLDSLKSAPEQPTIDPINILTNNHMEIKTVLNDAGIIVPGTTETDFFENTSLLIDEIKMGYVKPNEKDGIQTGKMYPAWIFRVGGIEVYYDIFSGKLLSNPKQGSGGV